MSVKVSKLSNSVCNKAPIEKNNVRLLCRWRVRPICPGRNVQPRQDPVVEAVFENVPDRHRVRREAVEEKGFELSLQEVDADEKAQNLLRRGGLSRGGSIEVRTKEVAEWMDQ